MNTPFSGRVDPAAPLAEYPRPQLVRDSFVNLNGPWDYAFTASDEQPARWDGTILVPFSPECPLSGVMRSLLPGGRLWYGKRFTLPASFCGAHTLLHFGAVDQTAQVFLNGVLLGSHTGGYLPFSFEVTEALCAGENRLLVCVTDESDTGFHSRGKQRLARGGIWYTPQSGIWQTVWLESVPEPYIAGLRITPCFDEAEAEITVLSGAGAAGEITLGGARVPFTANAPVRVPMPGFTPWSPENPQLYPFSVTLGEDRAESYLAMRKCAVERDEKGVPRLFLNNRPYFQTGLLDQGYWPDGLLTAPTDEAMIFDIETMKAMGFNLLRKHIKIEPLRWYYHCDRLGMLVWQDMVNGGGQYARLPVTAPLVTGIHLSDGPRRYKTLARADEAGRAEYRRELDATVAHLYNCPCIVVWVPFNEGWGQFDALDAEKRVRALDTTRLVDHASGWHDQGGGDFKSLHVYFKPYRFRPDAKRRGRAVALTEFGGYALRVSGHCASEGRFGYKDCADAGALARSLSELYGREVIPAKEKGLSACVYTQLSDVEDECNGLLTYDRAVVKLPAEALLAINEQLRDK